MEPKETFVDGCGRNYADSQSANKKRQDAISSLAGFWRCRIARKAQGQSTDGLVVKKYGHINSAGCEGLTTAVSAAHHSIWRHLHDSMHAAKKPKGKLKFVNLDKESNMSTLSQREEFVGICSEGNLVENTQAAEVTIPVQKIQETQYNLNPVPFSINRFRGRRLDGITLNEALQIAYILVFELSTNRDVKFLQVKEAEANRQQRCNHDYLCAQSICSEVEIWADAICCGKLR